MIEKINSPKDVKKLNNDELKILAFDIREALIKKMSIKGGHFGPNLGAVELEIALHKVFNSPRDKFVFDVSHQSYTHKILTGRKEAFLDEVHYNDVSGYTNPNESKHDMFTIGHTSTSISLALGLAKARDIKGEKYNVIAIIGDGSLSGGEAFEGLDVAGDLESNFIIVFNDNQMSIAENHGGIYKGLEELRKTNGKSKNNIFKAFGLDYMYVDNGNDIDTVIKAFKKAKGKKHPIVVHLNTEKGHGYEPSLAIKSDWHYTMPFDIQTGKEKSPYIRESYSNITGNILKNRIDNGEDILAIVAALPFNIGFSAKDRLETYKDHFLDVGIAEETGIAIAAGAAKLHAKSVFATASSFLQRTYDQLEEDLCLDKNPATILVTGASIGRGTGDSTHLGYMFGSVLPNIPNLKVLAPTSKAEYINMFNWSLDQMKEPVAILLPANGIIEDSRTFNETYDKIHSRIEIKGKDIAIIGVADFYQYAEEIRNKLVELGYNPTLINPVCTSELDTKMLDSLKKYKTVITVEGSIFDGGYGAKVLHYLANSNVKVYAYGIKRVIYDSVKREEILKDNHMDIESIINEVKNA